MFHRCTMVLGTVCVTFLSVGFASAAVTYSVTDLGTCAGNSSSSATGISGNGQVTGYSYTGSNNYQAFLYSNGTMTALDSLGGSQSWAYGMSAGGLVTGIYSLGGNEYPGFIYSRGTMTNFSGSLSVNARAINDSGQVVGQFNYSRAYLYSDGVFTDIGALTGVAYSEGTGINASGQVAGWAQANSGTQYAFLYSDGTLTHLNTGYNFSGALGINAGGQVVGYANLNGNAPNHAFLYTEGSMTFLGNIGGSTSEAMAINSGGMIVGDATTSSGNEDAFLYGNGTMTDLNSLIDPASGWTLQSASAINDSGQIVGAMYNASGQTHAFLLTPIPEPSPLVLLGVSAISLLGFAWRRRRRGRARCLSCAAVVVAMLVAGSAQADVFNMGGTLNPTTGTWTGAASLQFVTVGDPGNAADTTGYGSVGYTYQMGKYDITAGQYTAFLNAVATTDTHVLYSSYMAVVGFGSGTGTDGCGIIQSGSSGSYTYAVATAYQNFPVNYVSWGNAVRFCNWLQNGQPVGPQGAGTTETGAYTLNADLMTVTRNAGATYFIPSEDEWYKAAYYKGGGTNAGYWSYPTQTNTVPSNVLSATGANNANFNSGTTFSPIYTDPTNFLTPVGAFADSPGPYGTYDMGGDLFQWNEADISSSLRGERGGDWDVTSNALTPSVRYGEPTYEYSGSIGFRVASLAVPEPGSIALLLAGAIGLFACTWRRRRV